MLVSYPACMDFDWTLQNSLIILQASIVLLLSVQLIALTCWTCFFSSLTSLIYSPTFQLSCILMRWSLVKSTIWDTSSNWNWTLSICHVSTEFSFSETRSVSSSFTAITKMISALTFEDLFSIYMTYNEGYMTYNEGSDHFAIHYFPHIVFLEPCYQFQSPNIVITPSL